MAKYSVSHGLLTYHIYALIDPRTETVYYVGQTIDLTNRMYGHKTNGRNAHKHSQPVYQRTNGILEAGLEPIVVVLDSIETYHLEIALRLEECYRIEMLNQDEILANAWKTGRCIDTENPMQEAAYIKQFALVTDSQLAELKELDKQRAFKKVFGGI